jgi:hypothetical protein
MKHLMALSSNAAHGMNRRSFLKSSAVGCGIIGAGLFTSRAATSSAASAQSEPNIIGPREGFSPQIGTLVSMDQHWTWGPTNNYCKWFHVCEHESHHNGQVTWIKARLPGAKQSKD